MVCRKRRQIDARKKRRSLCTIFIKFFLCFVSSADVTQGNLKSLFATFLSRGKSIFKSSHILQLFQLMVCVAGKKEKGIGRKICLLEELDYFSAFNNFNVFLLFLYQTGFNKLQLFTFVYICLFHYLRFLVTVCSWLFRNNFVHLHLYLSILWCYYFLSVYICRTGFSSKCRF